MDWLLRLKDPPFRFTFIISRPITSSLLGHGSPSNEESVLGLVHHAGLVRVGGPLCGLLYCFVIECNAQPLVNYKLYFQLTLSLECATSLVSL